MTGVDLIDLAKQNPLSVAQYSIQQIVAICGDGNLSDDSLCSTHLREFLALQSTDRLSNYARYCLDESFNKSGHVLQDIVNEIGRRLGYVVTNGRYQGVKNQIGFDGLWFDGTQHIVVEVKTTDAYRINIDTIRAYSDRLQSDGKATSMSSLLIVVGRQDTGDLEAQVRGSRHAWSTRLVSVDALVKLMFINEEVDDRTLLDRIRKILLPFEYTRVDNIVDLVFEAQQESEQKAQTIEELPDQEETSKRRKSEYVFTPMAQLEAKRMEIVNAFFRMRNSQFARRSKTNFSDKLQKIGIAVAVSKRYKRDYQPYWYALHPQWVEFLRSVGQGFFVLGCMDREEAFALPLSFLEEHLDTFNRTEKADRHYWHIALTSEEGRLALNLSKIGKRVDISSYAFGLTT